MTFTIGGVDITPYIAPGGIKWTREDIDGPNTGRSIDGTLRRDRVATKFRADITCRSLTLAEAATVLGLIYPQWISVTATNPFVGDVGTYTMYSNNIPITYSFKLPDGTEWWGGISFPLIQQ